MYFFNKIVCCIFLQNRMFTGYCLKLLMYFLHIFTKSNFYCLKCIFTGIKVLKMLSSRVFLLEGVPNPS